MGRHSNSGIHWLKDNAEVAKFRQNYQGEANLEQVKKNVNTNL